MWPHPQFLADLVTFTEEILNVKYHFLCSVKFWEGSKYASDNLPAKLFINFYYLLSPLLREKYPYSEFFWSLFSRIRTEYGEILRIQSKYWKIQTRKTPNTNTFLAVSGTLFSLIC